MDKCVNIEWKNGFGNQLFQYAYGKILSEQMNIKLTFSKTVDRWKGTSLLDLNFIDENHIQRYNDEAIKVNIDYNKEQAVELENPHNYKPYLTDIKSWFPKVKKTNTEDLLIHVRVGDTGTNIHTPFEWYKRVIEDNSIEFNKIFIITDSPDNIIVKELLTHYESELVSTKHITSVSDRREYKKNVLDDFNFIRKFNKILFSNSTFSWWASLLSEAEYIWFNSEWQINHYNGLIKLGETDYDNWVGVSPFSLKI